MRNFCFLMGTAVIQMEQGEEVAAAVSGPV